MTDKLDQIKNTQVAAVYKQCPKDIINSVLRIRELILDTAQTLEEVKTLNETLKWGEPAYLSPIGSTMRIGWPANAQGMFGLYFNCKSKLVDTFRVLYSDKLRFEGNRAVLISVQDELPITELEHCVELALTYHKRKHLDLLGA